MPVVTHVRTLKESSLQKIPNHFRCLMGTAFKEYKHHAASSGEREEDRDFYYQRLKMRVGGRLLLMLP